MKKLIFTFVIATQIVVSAVQPRSAQALCSGEWSLIAAGILASVGATNMAVSGALELSGNTSEDANRFRNLGGPIPLMVAAMPLVAGIVLTAAGNECQEYYRDRGYRERERRETPASLATLEAAYIPSLTNHGREWPEMTVAHCRGMGFDQGECRNTLVPAWNEDRGTLQAAMEGFFQRFNEELSHFDSMSHAQRRNLAMRFAAYIDEEVLPHVADGTVRLLHAFGRAIIGRFHASRVTADLRALEIPVGDSPVYVAPNGVGFHF